MLELLFLQICWDSTLFLILHAVFNCILPPKAPPKVPHQWARFTYTWSGFKHSHKCLAHSIIAGLSSSAVRFKKYLLCVVEVIINSVYNITDMRDRDGFRGGLPPTGQNFGQFLKDFFQFFQDFVHFFQFFQDFFNFFKWPHTKTRTKLRS